MSTPFDTLTALRDEWLALQPLAAGNEARLWKKLRLEWNYHSNHIEGNTLTYGETELLLLHDRTTGNHSHREYLEMKAHDVAIEHVRKMATEPARLITEADVRGLNQIILKESFWKAAETPDGQPTRKEIIPGEYKTSPNNVRLPNGDIFFFASVEDTPPRMAALMDWLRQELQAPTLHPVALAAKLHHEFVLIHPFGDGNGRVARLLVNYVLMRHGYLPLIVRTEDKANYLTALQLADAGELNALIAYFHTLTEQSLHLGIKAAKGEAIDEPSDVEKEVSIFVRQQQARKQGDPVVTKEMIHELITTSLRPFLERVETKLQKLVPLFKRARFMFRDGLGTATGSMLQVPMSNLQYVGPGEEIVITFFFIGYQGEAPTPFDLEVSVGIHFPPGKYTITHDGQVIASHDYSTLVLAEEAELLSSQILAEAFAKIKELSGVKE
jgi:Fic family protein